MKPSTKTSPPCQGTQLPSRHKTGKLSRFEAGLSSIPNDIIALAGLDRPALIGHWISAFECPPPKGLSRRILEYAAAYALQSKAHGGLRPIVRRKLRQLTGSGSPSIARPAASKGLAPGSRLVREWHGRTCTVDVLETGFQFDGQHYASLSAVARAITGARWSGPRFFGL
jgi:hypothetical protein